MDDVGRPVMLRGEGERVPEPSGLPLESGGVGLKADPALDGARP